ncbi:hypothetical protein CO613_10230 [Lysobacteraceae bacterium NML07-0707]|nr:hypothetical protein CO613_10230 [Xanthomonadaceae bacterium NML07-0707]
MTGDAVSMMIARQAWETRCAVERLNDIQVTGDVENCDSPFSVTGTSAQVHNLRALREKICGEPWWAKGDKPDTGSGNGGGDGDDGESTRFGLGFGPDMLDTENIFGAGACPTFTVTIMNATFSTSDFPAWCRLVSIMRSVVLIMGTYTALMILYGRN